MIWAVSIIVAIIGLELPPFYGFMPLIRTTLTGYINEVLHEDYC